MGRSKGGKKDTLAARQAFINAVASDAAAVDILISGDDHLFHKHLSLKIAGNIALQRAAKQGSPSIRTFTTWCSSCTNLPDNLRDALTICRNAKVAGRLHKVDFIKAIGLNWSVQDRNNFLNTIPKLVVAPLMEHYPPYGEAVAESPTIRNLWYERLYIDPQPDKRRDRTPIHNLHYHRLAHNIKPHDSFIFVNQHGELVGMVIRNACGNQSLLQAMSDAIGNSVDIRTSIRKEDPGSLIQMGYSAGARSKPSFNWVKNAASKKATFQPRAQGDDSRMSSFFALAWQIMRKRVLPEVIKDFEEYLRLHKLKRMDANGQILSMPKPATPFIQPLSKHMFYLQHRRKQRAQLHYAAKKGGGGGPVWEHHSRQVRGTFSAEVEGHLFKFHNAELAPPTGVMGQNYARAIHHENQPHKFAISWTVSRAGNKDAGGHFYMPKYGIRIEVAPDTIIVWQPSEPHGTSLPDCSPYDESPAFCQRGLAFVTSPRLPTIWQQYINGNISQAEAEDMLCAED